MQLNELETALLGRKSASLIYGKRRPNFHGLHARWLRMRTDDKKNLLFSGKKHREILNKKSAYLAVKEKRVIYIMLALISKLQEKT